MEGTLRVVHAGDRGPLVLAIADDDVASSPKSEIMLVAFDGPKYANATVWIDFMSVPHLPWTLLSATLPVSALHSVTEEYSLRAQDTVVVQAPQTTRTDIFVDVRFTSRGMDELDIVLSYVEPLVTKDPRQRGFILL